MCALSVDEAGRRAEALFGVDTLLRRTGAAWRKEKTKGHRKTCFNVFFHRALPV